MPISLLEQKNKNKLLMPILAGIVLITLIIIFGGFLKKPKISSPAEEIKIFSPKININWEILKNPILDKLEPFEIIPPLPGSHGRKNPFLPY